MAKSTKGSKSGSGDQDKPEGTNEKEQYLKRLKEDVSNAQYMMIYATTNCKKNLDQKTIETLINARLLIESGKTLDAVEEANFRIAYQKLWGLVQPATAESIKANTDIEKTFFGRQTSKSRKSVNLYIVFTAAVLTLLLIFQIYWVIGNQLTTQLNTLLDKKAELTLKLNANQKEYKSLETRYMQDELDAGGFYEQYSFKKTPEWQRDTLDNIAEKDFLNADLESLNTQIERNLRVLKTWNKPWASLLEPVYESGAHSPKYQALFDDIENQIELKKKDLITDKAIQDAILIENSGLQIQLETKRTELDGLEGEIAKLKLQLTPEAQSRRKALLDDIVTFQNKRKELLELWSVWQATPGGSEDERDAQTNIDNFEDVVIQLDKETIDLLADDDDVIKNLGNDEISLKAYYNYDDLFASLDLIKGKLENRSDSIITQQTNIQREISELKSQQDDLKAQLVTDDVIKTQWENELDDLMSVKAKLERDEKTDTDREDSRAAQLAGQFVLNILQSYILPILYGLLGAGTFVLRSLSRKIVSVTYSGVAEIQHILSITLGALTGIVVGWFSFLLPQESTGFLGSVSPLAIAFLVGYNIEPFFSKLDNVLKKDDVQQPAKKT